MSLLSVTVVVVTDCIILLQLFPFSFHCCTENVQRYIFIWSFPVRIMITLFYQTYSMVSFIKLGWLRLLGFEIEIVLVVSYSHFQNLIFLYFMYWGSQNLKQARSCNRYFWGVKSINFDKKVKTNLFRPQKYTQHYISRANVLVITSVISVPLWNFKDGGS